MSTVARSFRVQCGLEGCGTRANFAGAPSVNPALVWLDLVMNWVLLSPPSLFAEVGLWISNWLPSDDSTLKAQRSLLFLVSVPNILLPCLFQYLGYFNSFRAILVFFSSSSSRISNNIHCCHYKTTFFVFYLDNQDFLPNLLCGVSSHPLLPVK